MHFFSRKLKLSLEVMNTFSLRSYVATLSYISMILILNTLFIYLPFIAAFGQTFSAADVLVGSIYIARDFAQREIKHYIFVAMFIGCLLSYLLANELIAIASASAFFIGELLDWAIFTYTQKPFSQRLLLSSVISCPIDTLVFLGIANRLHSIEFVIMTLGKILGIFLLWLFWNRFAQRKKHTLARV